MCFRWIKDVRVNEHFVGYYENPDIKSGTIVTIIKDSLIRMQLSLNHLRAQAYEGATNMFTKILVFLSKLRLNNRKSYRPTVKNIC